MTNANTSTTSETGREIRVNGRAYRVISAHADGGYTLERRGHGASLVRCVVTGALRLHGRFGVEAVRTVET